ncbi:MAG: hypothetical protein ACPL4H_09525 [Anaerolineales bacterium]
MNLILGRSDDFWHHGSYDHVIRCQKELENTIWYILENPIKAGQVESWKDWKFTYLSDELVFISDK